MAYSILDLWLPGPDVSIRPTMVIVHSMGEWLEDHDGRVLSARDFLERHGLSAHALVQPDGTVLRTREPTAKAYHARRYNSVALGVEVLVPGVHTYASFVRAIQQPGWCTDEAFDSTQVLVQDWLREFAIDASAVRRHSDVDPRRKVDPGEGFDWERFLRGLNRGS